MIYDNRKRIINLLGEGEAMKFYIKEARERAGLSQKELAKIIGVAPNTFHGYESGKHDPKSDLLVAIAQICNTSVDYLLGISDECHDLALTGGQKKFPLPYSDDALKLAKDFDSLDRWWKKAVRELVNTGLAQSVEESKLSDGQSCERKLIYIPEPLQSASAGTGEFSDDDIAEQVAVLYNKYTSKADYIMRVHGNSMEPQIFDGDRVLVRSQPAVDLGETGIFILNGDRYVKIYRGSYLESANPTYANVPVCEDGRCIGKVISVLNPEWVVEK